MGMGGDGHIPPYFSDDGLYAYFFDIGYNCSM
jgi:hypothetical protein